MKVSFEGKTIGVKKISVDNGNYIIYEGNDGKYYLNLRMETGLANWAVTVEISPEQRSVYTFDINKFKEVVETYRTQEYKRVAECRQKTEWYERVGEVRKKKQKP